ncbi:unnamed protein product, partial [Polarella glacialis]
MQGLQRSDLGSCNRRPTLRSSALTALLLSSSAQPLLAVAKAPRKASDGAASGRWTVPQELQEHATLLAETDEGGQVYLIDARPQHRSKGQRSFHHSCNFDGVEMLPMEDDATDKTVEAEVAKAVAEALAGLRYLPGNYNNAAKDCWSWRLERRRQAAAARSVSAAGGNSHPTLSVYGSVRLAKTMGISERLRQGLAGLGAYCLCLLAVVLGPSGNLGGLFGPVLALLSLGLVFIGGMQFSLVNPAWAMLTSRPGPNLYCAFSSFFVFAMMASLALGPVQLALQLDMAEEMSDVRICDWPSWQDTSGGVYFRDGTIIPSGEIPGAGVTEISVTHCEWHSEGWEPCR